MQTVGNPRQRSKLIEKDSQLSIRIQCRLLHIHRNVPGILTAINSALSEADVNVAGQYLQTQGEIGYVVIDIDADYSQDVRAALSAIDGTIRTRILY